MHITEEWQFPLTQAHIQTENSSQFNSKTKTKLVHHLSAPQLSTTCLFLLILPQSFFQPQLNLPVLNSIFGIFIFPPTRWCYQHLIQCSRLISNNWYKIQMPGAADIQHSLKDSLGNEQHIMEYAGSTNRRKVPLVTPCPPTLKYQVQLNASDGRDEQHVCLGTEFTPNRLWHLHTVTYHLLWGSEAAVGGFRTDGGGWGDGTDVLGKQSHFTWYCEMKTELKVNDIFERKTIFSPSTRGDLNSNQKPWVFMTLVWLLK